MLDAPATARPAVTRAAPGPRRLLIIVLVAVLAGATAVVTAIVAVPPTRATPGLCVNVALDRGLSYRGAYGATPWAFNPMSSVMLRNMGNGAAVGDIERDGDLDVLMLGQLGHPNALFRNELGETGRATFTDITAAAGLTNAGGSRTASFADLDNDGDEDLVVINDFDGEAAGRPSAIFANDGSGTFTDATPDSGFAPVGYLVGGLSLADYDRDGLLDIYVSYWTMELGGDPSRDGYARGQFLAVNSLFRNLGGLRFADATADAGLGNVNLDSFSSIFADFTQDGWPDLYVAVDHRPDIFYVNEPSEDGGRRFRRATDEFGLGHVGNDMGVAVTDLESDGLLDLYVTNISDETGRFGNGQGNTLMRASRGADGHVTYRDEAPELGIADTGWGWGTAFTDIDLDGSIDLYAVQGMQEFIAQQAPELRAEEAHLFLNDGDVAFREATKNGCDIVGDQRAVVPFDYDRDGAPDLLITQLAYTATLLENQTSGQGWLTIDLSRAGAQAAGARVRVTVGGRTTTQVALYGGSYLAGMPRELYFGLGPATGADDVTITWADGSTTALGAVAGDRVLTVTPAGVQE